MAISKLSEPLIKLKKKLITNKLKYSFNEQIWTERQYPKQKYNSYSSKSDNKKDKY